MKLSVASN